uniref:Uncharacterized protein n=1 Tax=Arundo donax TaxID=35708 RepID=A0A0A9E2R4_ARUDO
MHSFSRLWRSPENTEWHISFFCWLVGPTCELHKEAGPTYLNSVTFKESMHL